MNTNDAIEVPSGINLSTLDDKENIELMAKETEPKKNNMKDLSKDLI